MNNKVMEKFLIGGIENIKNIEDSKESAAEETVGTLDLVLPGESVEVVSVDTPQPMRRRLIDLGFLEGSVIRCEMKSPLGDPSAYLVRGTLIALRSEDARTVAVKTVKNENY